MATDGNMRIEALEHQLMRSWLEGDRKMMKKLLSSRFRLVVGGKAPVLLDRKSLVEAVPGRWSISSFRFGSALYAREISGIGIFAAEVELEARIDGRDLSGRWWMSDLWRKSSLTRRWHLLDRQLARPDSGTDVPAAVRSLQLWR